MAKHEIILLSQRGRETMSWSLQGDVIQWGSSTLSSRFYSSESTVFVLRHWSGHQFIHLFMKLLACVNKFYIFPLQGVWFKANSLVGECHLPAGFCLSCPGSWKELGLWRLVTWPWQRWCLNAIADAWLIVPNLKMWPVLRTVLILKASFMEEFIHL